MQSAECKIAGGWGVKDADDADVKAASTQAVHMLNSRLMMNSHATKAYDELNLDAHAPLKLVNVLKAETQVVAGINYKLHLHVEGQDGSSLQLEVMLWSRPWLATEGWQLTSIKKE